MGARLCWLDKMRTAWQHQYCTAHFKIETPACELQVFHETDGKPPPNSLWPAALKIALSFLYLACFASLVPHYPMQMVWGDAFARAGALRRCAFVM